MYHGQLVLTCNGQTSVVGGTYGCVDADINVLHEHPVVVHFVFLGQCHHLFSVFVMVQSATIILVL